MPGDVDTASPAARARLLRAVEHGVPRELLAERYGISQSNVKVIASKERAKRNAAEKDARS